MPGYVDPYSQVPGQQPPGYPQGPYPRPPKKPKKSVWKRWWMICIYIILGLSVIANLGGGGSDAASSGSSAATDSKGKQATTKETNAAEKKAGIGTPVTSDELTMTVTAFKCGVSVADPIEDLSPQGQFCKMSVTIKNDGSDQATVDDSQIKVKDAKGNEYSTSSDTVFVDGSIFLKQINPGNKLTGVAYYDVPVGTTPVTAEFRGSILSSAAEVSLS
ncbi:DUF4352 domain-containing protein [Acidipropionibacterium virtanenii]|uniref:DUF4352 domain-containing protein n=1 Tax=Acidipropionibacterium virtanenii TaxID=2057246 RepID=A0A344UWP4_9ACTN|nr:DUF4352 domain-containing protein [Acidipropionibacterium virtanenii]AXE39692.1 hypothetical protein JS278_02554 [Acidipropionibacterium virtanenii]